MDDISIKFKEEYKVLLIFPEILSVSPQCFKLYGGVYIFRSYINTFLTEYEYTSLQSEFNNFKKSKKEKIFFNFISGLLEKKYP